MFLNTDHTSEDVEELKQLIAGEDFRGFRVQIVNDEGAVVFAPPVRERPGELTVSDIATRLGVPIVELPEEAFGEGGGEPTEVGYTLAAVHESTLEPIVSLSLTEQEARQIIQRLWPDTYLWAAPGGCSFHLAEQRQADVVNDVLSDRRVVLNPEKHRWLLHVHLLLPAEGE